MGHKWWHGLRACIQAQLERGSRSGPGLAGLAWAWQSLPAGLFWMVEETREGKAGFPEQRKVQGQVQGERKAVLVLCKAHQASLCSKGLLRHRREQERTGSCISSHQQISVKMPQTVVLKVGRVL